MIDPGKGDGRTGTRGDELRRVLEEEIVAGTLRPGQRLDEQALALRFHVSRTPVREALRQLAASGLVETRPRQVAVVATMTIPRMIEMFEVMAELEGLCARLAARRMTDEERAELKQLHEACRVFVESRDADAYYAANKCFHEAVYAGSHNECLEEMTRSIRNRLSPYRRLQLRQPRRLADSFAEHEAVVRSIVAGDADNADQLMRGHVNIQGELFADLISCVPKFIGQTAAGA